MTLQNGYTKIEPKYYALEKVFKDQKLKYEFLTKKLRLVIDFNIERHYDELYVLCYNDPLYFSVFMLDIIPRPHQMYMLERMTKTKRLAMCLGRRMGKTLAVKIFVLWATYFNKFPSELSGTTFNIICQDGDTGKDSYMEEFYMIIEEGDDKIKNIWKGKLGDNWFTSKLLTKREKSGKVTASQLSIKILDEPSQQEKICKIRVLPPTNKARSKEGNFIGDEVSSWKYNNSCPNDIDFYDTVVHPILSDNPNYVSILLSTPNGYGDVWERNFDPEKKFNSEYEQIWLPCWAYTKPEYLAMMEELKSKYASRGEMWKFQQEYEARFVQMRDQYFDENNHIQQFLSEKSVFREPINGSNLFLGLDFGGTMTSHTAIAIAEETQKEQEANLIYYKEYPVNQDNTLLTDINNILRKYPNIRKLVYDNKGGRFIEQKLKELYGDYRIQPFNFSTDKLKGYSLLKSAMHNNKIKAPKDKLIQAQLRNFTDKLKPQSKEISDDVLDAIMMAFFPILDKNITQFKVVTY